MQLIAWLLCVLVASPVTVSPAQSSTPSPTQTYNVTFSFTPSAESHPVSYEVQSGLLIFRAQVQGRDIWAMLDNGVQTSTIDVNLARQVGLEPSAPIGPLVTSGGATERRRVLGVDVNIPGQVRYQTPMSTVDLSQMSSVVGRPIGLVIGREIFKNMTFVIRPSRGTFELGVSGRVHVPETVPYLTLLDDDAHAEGTISGRSVTLMVDLGYNGRVLLSPEAWTRSDLDQAPYQSGQGADMIGTRVEQRRANIPEIHIGPFTRMNIGAVRAPVTAVNRDGLLGFGFLSGFDFAIDVKTRRLWLLRDLAAASPSQMPTTTR